MAYVDERKQEEAKLQRAQARRRIARGQDPVEAVEMLVSSKKKQSLREYESRPLLFPEEVMRHSGQGRGFAWIEEAADPVFMKMTPFWDVLEPSDYLDNPLFNSINGKDQVRVRGRFGRSQTLPVVEVPVPHHLRNCWHFKHGNMPCRVVKGFEPEPDQ